MRMWMIDTKFMCNQHLLGEHSELHKFRHNFVKKHNMGGRLAFPSQISPRDMLSRHDELAEEMARRGMNHKSPYQDVDVEYLFNGKPYSYECKIDIEYNLKDLAERCPACRERIENDRSF